VLIIHVYECDADVTSIYFIHIHLLLRYVTYNTFTSSEHSGRIP